MIRAIFLTVFAVSFGAAQEPLPALDPVAAAKISYRREVAPILKRHCQSCHTKNDLQGELNLDTVKLFERGGKTGPAFKPGKPDESLAVLMMTGAKKPVMPHKQPPLSPAKIHTVRQWILAGAKDDSEPVVAAKVVIPKTYQRAPAVTSVAFSPDGKYLAAACRSEVVVVSVEGEPNPQRLATESDLLTCVTFTPDGKTLAAIGGSPGEFGEVRFFEANAGTFKPRFSRRVGKDTFFRGGFSPDGKTLAVGGADGAIHLLPIDEKAEARKYELHSDWINAVAWSVDGRLLISAGRDKTVKVAMAQDGKLLRTIATSTESINTVGATATVALSAGRDRIPSAYDLKQSLGDVALTGSGNGMVPVNNASQYTRRLEGQGGEVLDMAFDAKRTKMAVAGVSGEVRIYNLPDGRRLANVVSVPSPVYGVGLSADGAKVATGSQNGQVGIYDAATGKLIKQLIPVPVQ